MSGCADDMNSSNQQFVHPELGFLRDSYVHDVLCHLVHSKQTAFLRLHCLVLRHFLPVDFVYGH